MNSSIYDKNWKVFKARELATNKLLETDVVVVGSGAGGGFSAEILAKYGFNVIILEEGPYRNNKHFNMMEKQAYPDLYQEGSGRKTKDKGINILQGRSVGGSTTINWTSSFRTPEKTLNHWADNFSLEDINSQSMKPWFDKVEKQLSISPWTIPANENNQILARGMDKLGWSSKVIPRNVSGCANLGYCGMGCPIDAKQSMLVTTIPSALSQGATLISRARVENFEFENGSISSVKVRPLNTKGQVNDDSLITIKAKHVILAAGGIGSPAIMMRSKAPDPYSLLGKRTFLHPTIASSAIMPEAVNAFSGAPQSIYSDEFLWRDGVAGEMGYKLEVSPLYPLLLSSIMPGHGERHRKLIQKYPNLQALIALHRDGFNSESEGGAVELDDNNLPLLDYPLTEMFWRSAKDSLLKMAEIQFAAGAKQIMPLHSETNIANSWSEAKSMIKDLPIGKLKLKVFSAHVMGGCGMGADEKNSVVNGYGEHHQISNLTINDGSIFPTSLGVNPQLTIYSLAMRNATYLAERLR